EESIRMGRLVQDLLDLAKMESGHLEMTFTAVNIGQLLRRVYRKFHSICKEQELELQCFVPDDDSLIIASGDEDRLEQVLTNLLDNAIRHTNPGKKIRLSASRTRWDDADWIQIEVADEGQGIPEDDLP